MQIGRMSVLPRAVFAVLALCLVVGEAGAAWAMEPGGAFLQCRSVADATQRLACYDTAAASFEKAQARGDVVIVDREKVRAVRRQAFGFHLPSLDLLPKARDEAPIQNVAFTLASAGRSGDGKWAMSTEEGALWVQTDSEELLNPPHAGSKLAIRAGALGGFFCKVDGQSAIRCQRRR